MRNWQPQKTRSSSLGKLDDVLPVMNGNSNSSKPSDTTLKTIQADAHRNGPELLLRVVDPSSLSLNDADHFDSLGSSTQLRSRRKVWADRRESPRPQRIEYCIPMSDIVVADLQDAHLLFLTTLSNGYFEFCFRTANARDMMVAFLNASLSPERILSHPRPEKELDPFCSFDVETLTAKRIEERMRTETLSEKLRRRVAHVALQIGESE